MFTVPSTLDEFWGWVEPHWLAMGHVVDRLVQPDDRDDVLQDAFTEAWRKRETYDPGRSSPRTWLVLITTDRVRKNRRGIASLTRAFLSRDAPIQSTSESRLDLDRAVQKLPERQKIAVTLYYYVGLTMGEVCAVMGCSEGTGKSTLFDARKNLRNALGEDYV